MEHIDRDERGFERGKPQPNEVLVDWLLACPEKDLFVPIESESTDALEFAPQD